MAGQIIKRGDKKYLLRIVFLGRDPDTGKAPLHKQDWYNGTKKTSRAGALPGLQSAPRTLALW